MPSVPGRPIRLHFRGHQCSRIARTYVIGVVPGCPCHKFILGNFGVPGQESGILGLDMIEPLAYENNLQP